MIILMFETSISFFIYWKVADQSIDMEVVVPFHMTDEPSEVLTFKGTMTGIFLLFVMIISNDFFQSLNSELRLDCFLNIVEIMLVSNSLLLRVSRVS